MEISIVPSLQSGIDDTKCRGSLLRSLHGLPGIAPEENDEDTTSPEFQYSSSFWRNWYHAIAVVTRLLLLIRDVFLAVFAVYQNLFSLQLPNHYKKSQEPTLRVSKDTPLETVVRYFRVTCNLMEFTPQLTAATSTETSEPFCTTILADIYKITLSDETLVGVKCVRRLSHEPDKLLKRSARELEAWRCLNHENILPFLGFAVFRGKLAMVSPWMVNGNVIEYLGEHPGVDRYQLCRQLAGVIRSIHGQNVVHGDLKGANILVSNDGKLKLADFGLSVFRGSMLEFSGTNETVGTLRWQAPELITGNGSRSKEADVYSLGMTMLEILTGKPPFNECERWGLTDAYEVASHGRRPDRPCELNGESSIRCGIWSMLQASWVHVPNQRPTAYEVYCEISLRLGCVPGSLPAVETI